MMKARGDVTWFQTIISDWISELMDEMRDGWAKALDGNSPSFRAAATWLFLQVQPVSATTKSNVSSMCREQ